MDHAKAETAHLLIVRLNNWLPIRAAYGEGAASAAMERLRAATVRRWGPAQSVRVERDEMEMLIRRPPLASFAATLASGLGVMGEGPLLSVSAGYGSAKDGLESARRQARVRLSAAPNPHPATGPGTGLDGAAYRRDMVLAGVLARDLRSGRLQPVQRPVARLRDPADVLFHDMTLANPGQIGAGDTESYAALDRLGMAHRMDRALLSAALDALAADRRACLSVALSMRSLSLDLHGCDAGWDDLLDPLRGNPDLGRRLIVEINDQAGADAGSLLDVRLFVAELRALGVRIAIGGFGAGQLAIDQWLALSPDIVRLDRRFLHLASRSDADRARLRRMMVLARTLCATLIVDGVDHGEDRRIAWEERAEWIAGAILSPVAPAQPAFAYTQNSDPIAPKWIGLRTQA